MSKLLHSCCLLIALIMLSLLCSTTRAAPYQELAPRKGHVPVYIRHGDEALSQIHPGLAEAFKEQPATALQGESLIKLETEQGTETPAASTESDIASFDAIKTKEE